MKHDQTTLRRRADDLLESIGPLARASDPVRIMEVCGTHTVSLRRHGIHSVLPPGIDLISGPGCPVCVTPTGYIDNALALLESDDIVVATFGDMLKIPGSDGRSLSEYIGGGRVRVVYSPLQLADICNEMRPASKTVVFLAIGFETTIPAVLGSLKDAVSRNESSLAYYTAFKTVPPALTALLSAPDHAIDGFLLPGHVSMILGVTGYDFLERFGVPGVVTGFEPLEMLEGIDKLLAIIRSGEFRIGNAYPAVVRRDGNPRARNLIDAFLEPSDADWRGLGLIPGSALSLRDEYAAFDAVKRFDLVEKQVPEPPGCRCGDVISGRCAPTECGHFGTSCTPDDPVGPCMVSSEGTCAAYLKYGGLEL